MTLTDQIWPAVSAAEALEARRQQLQRQELLLELLLSDPAQARARLAELLEH